MDRYSRADVLRILRISPKHLSAWEKAGLFLALETYSFSDLIQLTKLRDLRAKHVRPAVIRQSLEAMQRQVSGMTKPLLEAGTFNAGSRVVFRHMGAAVEPIAGQFVLDFASKDVMPSGKVYPIQGIESASELFAKGIALEEHPEHHEQAIHTYLRVIALDPRHAAAFINLGTLYYNRQDYLSAENCYRKAIAADAGYALAFFDLGNVLDETGRLQDAVQAYKSALTIAPEYADAHYNLALAYERLSQPRRALRHWRTYIKLDPTGPWSSHARGQAEKILRLESLRVISRHGIQKPGT